MTREAKLTNEDVTLLPTPKDWHLYFRLWEEAVGWASKNGATELQSGQTGYGAKLDLGHRLVPLTNYCQHLNPIGHRIFAYIARRISWSTLDEDLKLYVQAHGEVQKGKCEPVPDYSPCKKG